MSEQITLHHYWRSSCSWRVRWALNMKGLSYKSCPVNLLKGEHRSPPYLAGNPAGFLPGLEVNGQFFGESLAMLEWLDEQHPTPALLPTDGLARLRVRQLALIIASGTQPLQNPSVIGYYTSDAEKKKEYGAYWIKKGLQTFQTVRNSATPGHYSFGDSVTIADLCLIPQIYNALRFDVSMDEFSDLKTIYDRCLLLPDCDQAAPHSQPGAET